MTSESVYQLVGSLVGALGQECRYQKKPSISKKKKCKSLAFGILLGKRAAPDVGGSRKGGVKKSTRKLPELAMNDDDVQKTRRLELEQQLIREEPLEMMHCHLFEMQLRARYQFQKRRCERFDRVLDELDQGGPDTLAEPETAILQFLLMLRDSVADAKELQDGESTLAGDLMPSTHLGPYPIFRHDDLSSDTKKLNAYYNERANNPYCLQSTGSVFSETVSSLLRISTEEEVAHERQETVLPPIESTSYFSDPMAELVSYQGPFRYNMMRGGPPGIEDDEQLLTSFEVIPGDELSGFRGEPAASGVCLPREQVFNFNWESLGNTVVPVETPFASESNSVLHMKRVGMRRSKELLDIRIVRNEDFLGDLKFLLTGIGSRCFQYDDHNRFKMLANFTVDGVSPLTMKSVTDQFVELGTCFRRLQKMTKKNPYNHAMLLEGCVFKAFCDCVERILSCFRIVVNCYEGCSMLQLQRKIEPMRKQILILAKFCGVHPQHESDKDFPIGSLFLDQLYKEIIYITDSEVSTFLLHILKHCSHAYFLLFQQWLFGGLLRDPSGELFIYFVNQYRPKTKHFFDRAFLIRRQAVPGFLRGYEEDILLCGKYTMLLKAFRPTHPIFSLKIPKMEVCLSYRQVDQLKSRWLQYVRRARDICGAPVSVRELYEGKAREREQFLRLVEENFRRSMEQWRQDQDAAALDRRRRKERHREELLEQLREVQESKLAAKKVELELEQQYRQDALEFENRQLLAENVERERLVEGYRELNRMMDEKVARVEAVVDHLKVELAGGGGGESSENDFESCLDSSTTEDEDKSVYEDAQKSPLSDRKELTPDERSSGEEDETVMENDKRNMNDVISQSEKNKAKILGSNLGTLLKEDRENANVEAIKQTADAGIRELTEAQKNKKKILTQEFGLVESEMLQTVDVNSNQADEERHRNRQRILISDFVSRDDHNSKPGTAQECDRVLSELEKNRMKIMSQEYNVVVDDHEKRSRHEQQPREVLNLDLENESDRARNRRKILESEFNIITGVQNCAGTPMSIDSDTISEDIQLPVIMITNDDVAQDINANPVCGGGRLKLDTSAAQEKFNESRFGVPDTALLAQETPESGLNTAGLNSKEGFEFPAVRNSCSVLELSSEADYEEDEIYKEFMAAMKKRDTSLCELACIKDEIGSITELQEMDSELRSVDVLTVTKFLQSSLVIPLKAHMEIINSEIMKMCLNDLDILGHFESLRNYFLLMDGEFSCYVCDNVFKKLEIVRHPDELLNYQTLHTILDSALCSSAAGSDHNAERLSFDVEQIPEKFDLYHPNALSMLNLSYRVEWPLNLILNPETLEQYANIFRYLLKVRRISFVLGKSFQLLKESHKQYGKRFLTSPQYSRVQLICHKLSHLINALKNYITNSALQASWETFRKDLESAESMEELYRKHTNYIKRILFLCLLNKKSVEFYNNMEEIFRVILRFYKHLKSKAWRPQDKTNPASPFVHPKFPAILTDEEDFEKLIKYTIYLGNKMYDRGYQKEIHEFISVININDYYSQPPMVEQTST
ncbi:uncharacterized protein LOC129746120 [Uranotaenia lowii]|uniref:uncharacterized protein LOC129746120 n=1 Tax=Uranotaenia lowii TaxID=190385 RepID=UPI00247A4FDE|nr:uncharacterized protein LOC129746120 [Uranotaenia lowii]